MSDYLIQAPTVTDLGIRTCQSSESGPLSILTLENFQKGMLLAEVDGMPLIAGVATTPDGGFSAYVMDSESSEVFEYREFDAALEAIGFLNSLPFPWEFESVGCGKQNCSSGKCTQCGNSTAAKISQ